MVATRPITIEEFETLRLEGRWELIDGEPIETRPSADESSSIGATIITLLGSFIRPRGLGRLYGADGGFVLFPDRPTVRVPDAAFVRAERAPQGQARRSFLRLAPDLVVEVLSPSDRVSPGRSAAGLAHRPRNADRHRVPPGCRTEVDRRGRHPRRRRRASRIQRARRGDLCLNLESALAERQQAVETGVEGAPALSGVISQEKVSIPQTGNERVRPAT
jgi:hypothetical protein